jgi:hypothetical protein
VIRYLMFFMAAVASLASAADQPKKTVEPWYYKLARILGVDRAPVALKGPSSSKPGELWVGPADHAEPRRLTEGSDFTSPVFAPAGRYIFALHQNDLVRVAADGGPVQKVRMLPNIIKLVGFDQKNPDKVLALFESSRATNPRTVDVALVSVKTGKRQLIAARQRADSEEAESLLGWQRQYENVYLRPQGTDVVVGGIESFEIPVSDCRDAVCGQPSYSPALRQVVFVRSPLSK